MTHAGFVFLALFFLLLWPASAQLPPSVPLSEADRPSFQAEINRVKNLPTSATDKAAVSYEMARTWAAAKQWPETMEWLRKAVAFHSGLDPEREKLFTDLRETREFKEIVDVAREATPAVSRSSPAFTVGESDLVPESIAYHLNGRSFYLGSMKKGKILRCSQSGNCASFATGLGIVLGLKIRGDSLWVLSNSQQASALIHYDLRSGRELRRYEVTGPHHTFNDLAIAPGGEIYLTDTAGSAIWSLPSLADGLTRLPGRFESANGIAISSDARLLYVSTFPDGIAVLDLKTKVATAIKSPANLCLATIDGLYFYRGTLIAIQNGFMVPRVIRLVLTPDLRAIEQVEVLERRNKLFEGITTGVIAGSEFFYMANIQDDKRTGFNPITILKLPLHRQP